MKNVSKIIIFSVAALLIFIGLVFVNYKSAQKSLNETKPSVISISLSTYPENLNSGSTGAFEWQVEAPSDKKTSFTTIYWASTSSPSALLTTDNPDAVRYENYLLDYSVGSFSLPSNFLANIRFPKPGKYWFRAYAKIDDKNLWSDEKLVEVN